MTDFTQIGDAQTKVLSLKLDKLNQQQQGGGAASSSSGAGGASAANGSSTTVDPKGYLTDLDSVVHKTEAEIGDTKRGRMLLQSLTKSNKKHAPGWIAAARLEEVAGKMVAARKIIQEGCENCPKSEEVWREAARLNVRASSVISMYQDAEVGFERRHKRTPRLSSQMLFRICLRASTSGWTQQISSKRPAQRSECCAKVSFPVFYVC